MPGPLRLLSHRLADFGLDIARERIQHALVDRFRMHAVVVRGMLAFCRPGRLFGPPTGEKAVEPGLAKAAVRRRFHCAAAGFKPAERNANAPDFGDWYRDAPENLDQWTARSSFAERCPRAVSGV